jgi:phospholipase/carboxylesterase
MTTALNDIRSAEWTSGGAPAVAILLHGFGSNERDLTGLMPAFDSALPWASLRAPIDLGGGRSAWFEIVTPGNPDAEPVLEATAAIWDWIDANVDPSVPVIPIGFSQGGLMASQLLRTRPERVLATVILGGFVLGATLPADESLLAGVPPVFWGRGADDRVIGQPAIERTAAFLPQHSTLIERVYPGLAHGISAEELADVVAFVAEATAAR